MMVSVDIDKRKKMTEKDVKKSLRKLLISIRNDELEERIKKYYLTTTTTSNNNNSIEKTITYNDFITLVISLIEKQEIQPIFSNYSINPHMILAKDI